MAGKTLQVIVVGVALSLAACSFTEEALWPSLTGGDPRGGKAKSQPTPTPAQASKPAPAQRPAQMAQAPAEPAPAQPPAMAPGGAQPQLGTGNFEPAGVTPGQATGTYVGEKVNQLREELRKMQGAISQHNGQLQQLRAKTVQDSQRYHGTVAAINARLQVGTTPGNPILVQQYNSSVNDLDKIAEDVDNMNRLAQAVAADATMSSFLSESTRAAFRLSGAVDEDHRQLAILEDETNRTVVLIERLLKEVTDDVRRQTNYIASERANMNALAASIKSGELMGASLGARTVAALAADASRGAQPGLAGAVDITGRRPLVVIRFDRPNVAYEQALYGAVSRALERNPEAMFDLVAVTPTAGGQAKAAVNSNKSRRSAEGVLRSLVEMGLPPSRVVMSSASSGTAQANEVHLYLR
jgi:TolA-binding protein